MDGRQQYMMYTELVDVAIAQGGTVFGGYVRDFLRHEHAAKKFYETHKNNTDYANPEVSPETRDRLLIPSDIDVHFKNKMDYRKFRTELRGNFYHTDVVRVENIYTNDTHVHHLKLRVGICLEMGHIVRSLKGIRSGIAREVLLPELARCIESMSMPTFSVDIDILVSEKCNPPFNNLDFQCNGLVMNENGIGLCSELKKGMTPFGIHRSLMSIMANIERKTAVLVNIKGHRWDKMASKGWDIVGGCVEKRNECDATCTLCLDDVQPDCVYKFICCNASYHRKCMAKIITTGQTAVVDTNRCPHCRQGVYLSPEEVELFGEIIVNA
jgi:hypothetical protein